MKVTAALKSWLRDNKAMPADSSDEQVSRAAADALMDGSLDSQKFAELTADKDAQPASALAAALQGVSTMVDKMDQRLSNLEKPKEPVIKDCKIIDSKFSESAPKMPGIQTAMANSDGPVSTDPLDVKVITADMQYDTTRRELRYPAKTGSGARHPLAGQRVAEPSENGIKRYIDELSELDMALTGAWLKYSINCLKPSQIPASLRMTDHDNELVQYALHHCKFGGEVGAGSHRPIYLDNVKLDDMSRKALLDDGGASGALEAAPIVFDDALIQIPLLNGEFFPSVNLVTLSRGRRVEGVSAANVTLGASTEGTAINLFNTASFITAFDTTIHVVAGAIEIGLDFMSDSPINWSQVIQNQYAQQLLTWLDEQICIGDGTTEPEGIMVASGTTSVSAANAGTGPPTVGDYEGLLFGVAKAYKQGYPTNRIVYGANETTYRRARAIAVSGTDQRRVFGMTHEDYMLFGHPYGINAQMTNAQIFFANLARYRMYRRLGITTRLTTEGRTLVRANEMMISVRARFGGQLEDAAAAAVTTNAQT